MRVEQFLPIILKSPNVQEHWAKKRKRIISWQSAVSLSLKPKLFGITLPVLVTLIKIGGRRMDMHDNLPMAFKHIVDAIAVLLTGNQRKGAGDSDPRIKWQYAYTPKGKGQAGIKIIIEEAAIKMPDSFSLEELFFPFL